MRIFVNNKPYILNVNKAIAEGWLVPEGFNSLNVGDVYAIGQSKCVVISNYNHGSDDARYWLVGLNDSLNAYSVGQSEGFSGEQMLNYLNNGKRVEYLGNINAKFGKMLKNFASKK
jgi:hypothetical protein